MPFTVHWQVLLAWQGSAPWLARALAWSHAHPVLGRYTAAVFEPTRRESVPLALLASILLTSAILPLSSLLC